MAISTVTTSVGEAITIAPYMLRLLRHCVPRNDRNILLSPLCHCEGTCTRGNLSNLLNLAIGKILSSVFARFHHDSDFTRRLSDFIARHCLACSIKNEPDYSSDSFFISCLTCRFPHFLHSSPFYSLAYKIQKRRRPLASPF